MRRRRAPIRGPACSPGYGASFDWIVRTPPDLPYELCPPLTGTTSGRRNS